MNIITVLQTLYMQRSYQSPYAIDYMVQCVMHCIARARFVVETLYSCWNLQSLVNSRQFGKLPDKIKVLQAKSYF